MNRSQKYKFNATMKELRSFKKNTKNQQELLNKIADLFEELSNELSSENIDGDGAEIDCECKCESCKCEEVDYYKPTIKSINFMNQLPRYIKVVIAEIWERGYPVEIVDYERKTSIHYPNHNLKLTLDGGDWDFFHPLVKEIEKKHKFGKNDMVFILNPKISIKYVNELTSWYSREKEMEYRRFDEYEYKHENNGKLSKCNKWWSNLFACFKAGGSY